MSQSKRVYVGLVYSDSRKHMDALRFIGGIFCKYFFASLFCITHNEINIIFSGMQKHVSYGKWHE